MLIKLQRNLKMVSVNATKVEKIGEMVYGEIKAVYAVLSTMIRAMNGIYILLTDQQHTDMH